MKGYMFMITTINALVSNLLRRKSGQRLGCLLQTKMNISKESSPQTRSFYRRALPPSCTALSSEEGKALFESSLAHKGLKSFFQLIEQFTTQAEPAYCGISTLVMCLNAANVDPRQTWKGPWRWYTESMLNCCVDLEVMKEIGITFQTFACLARCQGLDVKERFASESTLDDFRNAVRLACIEDSEQSEEDPFLVVSYDRKVLNQTGSGHFSPIAAYDEESDKLLVLDTARFKYGAHWVPLPLLFEAMLTHDPTTNKSRGYILLSFQEDESHSTMPMSLLFRTSHQNAVRKEYKDFLRARDSQPLTWDNVLSYWTQEGLTPSYIWEMTKTQLIPADEKDRSAIASIRKLICDLIPFPSTSPDSRNGCYPNANRTICLNPVEAIFIVYLASIDLHRRKNIVLNAQTNEPLETKEQLLAEAELLHLAIEMSDVLDTAG